MLDQNHQLLLVSDFNTDILKGYLSNSDERPPLSAESAPYGQFFQTLAKDHSHYQHHHYDAAVIWTQPENVLPSFKAALNYAAVELPQILREVDKYCTLLLQFQESVGSLLVPSWVVPTQYSGYGMLDMQNGLGIANLLMRINLRLTEQLDGTANIHVLNTQKWIETAGRDAFNEKLWYLGKVPFGNNVFKAATMDIKSALRGLNGAAKKLVIVDLDNTLWGGIVGDDGWESLRLGGHDAVGEAFSDFQHALKSLTNRGILLAIASKNTEAVALEAMQKHPEMVLKLEDFVGWRINWRDKAENIQDLATELSLGLQSTVFIDDNPVERARVRDALPEVMVPEWPENSMLYKSALLQLRCFDTPTISQEDRNRSSLYTAERQRKGLKKDLGSMDDWLKTLEIKVTTEELDESNLARAVQLLNKTNQMNLSTRRLTSAELTDWLALSQRKMWVCRVADRFGDSGLTGIISLELNETTGQIIDFVLSCRVMGRKIEETLLYTAINYARSAGIEEVSAVYLPTSKNQPCLTFWQESAFTCNDAGSLFTWRTEQPYSVPDAIELIMN